MRSPVRLVIDSRFECLHHRRGACERGDRAAAHRGARGAGFRHRDRARARGAPEGRASREVGFDGGRAARSVTVRVATPPPPPKAAAAPHRATLAEG